MRYRQVHLDFHTSEHIKGIGEKFSKQQFQEMLKLGHVNSITLFSKCHHGWAYHPSKANITHPHLKFDLLGAQIEAAKEIGVKTPIYLSAGLDEKYAVEHKDEIAMIEPDIVHDFDSPGYHRICMNTPYLDTLLNQITEVLKTYDGDGIFLDIVGVHRCYCKNCMKTMQERGWSADDPLKVQELAEEVYSNYTRRVRETVDAVKPGHPVFHNSGHITTGKRYIAKMNTHLELESLPTGGWGYDHFPLTAAYARTIDMDFLGMTGKFHKSWGEFGGFKHPNALRFEAALSVANGACVSVGDQLHPSGAMDEATYKTIGIAYEEIEALEPWLEGSTACSEIALLSQEAVREYYEHPDFDLIGRDFIGNSGAARIMLEGKYMFDVADVETDLSKYKVVVLPDTILLDESLTAKLKKFTAGGGKILATGISGVNTEKTAYKLDFGAKYVSESEYQPDYLRLDSNLNSLYKADYIIYSKAQKIELCGGTELAQHIKPYFNRTKEHFCSHQHSPSSGENYGAGVVEGTDGIVIPWNIFEEYATEGSLIAKEIVHFALDRLLGCNKSVKTNLPAQGRAFLRKQNECLILHALYVSPVKRGNVEVVEDIIPVYNTEFEIRTNKKISKVYITPDITEIDFTQQNDSVKFTLPYFENHAVIVME